MRAFIVLLAVATAGRATAAQDGPPLYDNLGSLTHRITTPVPAAQRYFDQGLRLTYAFNHAEAIRAFLEAARLDSTCAICWWGAALAYGPNINLPMDSAAGAAAWDALQHARALRAHASPAEQAYIDALALRYGPNPTADRGRLDSAYAGAMREVARRHPGDLDAATLFAESMMDLRPWNYWAPDGTGYPGMDEVVATLAGALARNVNHPGACHFYIHAVESSTQPARALACARRLETAMPGAGHLVHMPGHLYLRLGRYADAQRVNVHAAHADESYIADQRPQGFYPLAYYPHNLHFLWAASAFEGRAADADSAMRRLRATVTPDLATQIPPLEALVLPWYYHLVWFGRWEEILRESAPPAQLLTSTGMWRYARGRAYVATGGTNQAAVELDSLRALQARADRELSPGITVGFAPPATILNVATHMLAGELASKLGRHDEAIGHLQQAVRLEDGLTYDEPADWYYPTRLSLGAAQLAAGRAADAEATYREELRRRPNSGWALFGLWQALRAQSRNTEAARVRQQFRRAWARADVTLTASRF
jgi:tetratricopeptide (TPR) repeat protein